MKKKDSFPYIPPKAGVDTVRSEVTFDVVFDGPPGAESGRFVETEIAGSGVGVGKWEEGRDGLWYLKLTEKDLIELARRVRTPRPDGATI